MLELVACLTTFSLGINLHYVDRSSIEINLLACACCTGPRGRRNIADQINPLKIRILELEFYFLELESLSFESIVQHFE